MANMRDLPEFVLRRILSLFWPSDTKLTGFFIGNLCLLSVCRQWRCIVEQLVYCNAFIQNSPAPDLIQRPGTLNKYIVKFESAVANGKQSLVKELTICFAKDKLTSTLKHASTLIARTYLHEALLITKLSFSTPAYSDYSDDEMDAPQETQDDEMVRARIVALLPDIAHIGVYSSASTDLSGSVSQLVNAYVDRLHSLAVSQPFELSFPRFGPQLRNLAISGCPEQRNSLPLVSAQSIETLDIGCMFNQLVWEEYVYGLNSNIMTFANLRELKLCILGVSDIQPLGRPPIHVLFPALKRLELDSGHRTYEIFGNAAINPNLRQLHVSGSLLALHALCRVGITSVNHLEVYVYRDQAAGEKVLVDTLNYFFGTVRSYRTSTLNLRAYAFDLGRHEIRWTYLQVLELNAPLVFSSLYWLIPRMPRLRSLDLMNVQVDRHSLMLLDSENRGADTTRPRPLSQTIYILQINRHRQDPPDMVYAVKSLVLQLPALQTIGLSPSITPAVEQLFDDELIPHGYFKSIEFM